MQPDAGCRGSVQRHQRVPQQVHQRAPEDVKVAGSSKSGGEIAMLHERHALNATTWKQSPQDAGCTAHDMVQSHCCSNLQKKDLKARTSKQVVRSRKLSQGHPQHACMEMESGCQQLCLMRENTFTLWYSCKHCKCAPPPCQPDPAPLQQLVGLRLWHACPDSHSDCMLDCSPAA